MVARPKEERMTSTEARRLVESLKGKMNVTDSETVIHEALKFYAWVLTEQEEGSTLYLEKDGNFEDLYLLYRRSGEAESHD